ncbi:MAG: helix-turn-helix domain-containing protein, partial [Thermomicrobiales bacterium]|nr:helix-turn-helix domain-containing protein [Thermomicrobiales bacterium]
MREERAPEGARESAASVVPKAGLAMTPRESPHLSTREAAAMLGLSERSVRRAIANGGLRATKAGRRYAIPRQEVERFAERGEGAGPALPAARLVAFRPAADAALPLPAPLSSFVGREQDLGRVLALLADPAARLVTLTGPGGIGKTRLAMATATAVRAAGGGEVAFIALDAIHHAEGVLPAIASGLGLHEPLGQSRLAQLQAALRHRRLLLVLDNFEQVLDAAPRVAELLAATARVTALVTSRAPLRIAGERELAIPPLSQAGERASVEALLASDAGRLFVERAREQAPGFAPDAASAPVIADICARLDGLPLAIELAAARINVLSPTQLRDRLSPRLPLLTRGARSAPSRHRTMRDAIAWSYDLLAPEEQALFRRLAVFAGGFTLEAGDVVMANGGWVMGDDRPSPVTHHLSPNTLDMLANLVEQSLLVRETGTDGAPRFRMLETIREFGLGQLAAAGEEGAARERHARYLLAMARALRPLASIHARQAPLDRLGAEQANIRAALHWLHECGPAADFTELAAALGMSWYAYGLYREGQVWLERALALADAATPADRARLLIGYAGVLFGQGAFSRAEPFLAEALALVAEAGEPLDRAVLLTLRGAMRNSEGRYAEAEAPLREALALAEQLSDPLLRAGVAGRALVNLSVSARGQQAFARAAAYGEEALRHYRGLQFDLAEAIALLDLAAIAHDAGDYALAARRGAEGIVLMGERGEPRMVADALSRVACVATACGEHRAALLLFGAAGGVRERVGAAMLWPVDIAAA